MRVTFTCGTVVSDPTLIKQLLRLGDLTDLLNTSGMMALDWEIPCAQLDFQRRAVELWPLPALVHWLRARGCAVPAYWPRSACVAQVHLLRGQRLRALEDRAQLMSASAAVLNDPSASTDAKAAATATLQTTATSMDADATILSKDFFLNQFYHKLVRHAFLPELLRFNNQARMLTFCDADYAGIQALLALIARGIRDEQAAAADKLSVKNSQRAVELVDAGYIHLSFFRFQDTMLYSDDSEEGVRCIVVRASVIASMNSTHYVTRILFTENMETGRWEATKQMKNCQCVSGSELEKLWCTHMAGVFVALAKLVRNRNRSLDGLKTTWPEDIVLLQSQPVRLSLVVGRRGFARSLLTNRLDESGDYDDGAGSDDTDANDEEEEEEEDDEDRGAGGGGGAAVATRPARRPRRRTLDPSGVKTLKKKDVDDDRSEYIADGLESLMQRRHVSVLRRVRTGPTNTGFNTNRNTYRPSAGEQ